MDPRTQKGTEQSWREAAPEGRLGISWAPRRDQEWTLGHLSGVVKPTFNSKSSPSAPFGAKSAVPTVKGGDCPLQAKLRLAPCPAATGRRRVCPSPQACAGGRGRRGPQPSSRASHRRAAFPFGVLCRLHLGMRLSL